VPLPVEQQTGGSGHTVWAVSFEQGLLPTLCRDGSCCGWGLLPFCADLVRLGTLSYSGGGGGGQGASKAHRNVGLDAFDLSRRHNHHLASKKPLGGSMCCTAVMRWCMN
jgi:hypothetical protein